jgi:phosphoribosylformylglycinamidine cyclo-ligase
MERTRPDGRTTPIGAPAARGLRPVSDADARAGFDIDAGNAAVDRYRALTADWRHPDQIGAIGGFSGLFRLPGDGTRALVGSTDGVGTKILIAAALERYDGVGRDLVNHCVNDILVVSAQPLFFLDYLAVGKLEPAMAADVVRGVQGACKDHAMALLGGETAEMPGLYQPGDFDLAGTIVGVVDLAAVPQHERVAEGDAILGLPSVGLHTNGYTLARALIPVDAYAQPFGDGTFGDALLAPHRSYYDDVRAIQQVADVKAMAHITGGGLIDNVPRTLPAGRAAVFEQARWSVPPIMEELVRRGNLGVVERYRTLNMGVGFTLTIPFTDAAKAIAAVPSARVVGFVTPRAPDAPAVVVHPARR